MIDEKQEKTWLYGVIPAGVKLKELRRRRDRLPGDVRVEEFGDLAAIVSHAPGENAKAIRDQALAHARVLEVAVLDAPVVPFRFGTVLPDGSVGSDLLEPWHDQLAQMLESVKDVVQLTLKVTYREDVILREIVDSNPEIAQLREQTLGTDEIATRDSRVRLGELISLTLGNWRQREALAILDRLNPLAVVSRVEALESEFMVLNAPFLVQRPRTEEFEDAAGAIADERVDRMSMALHGPMPAFDFIGEGQLPWE
ncbi:MAG TPA: GvpL/GvpF family gas vesicle protein [Solirubrobacteraceae bacterium]|nr:GvpL/GvpF family gas vesicle protein [Solirubrobacteraceae bacterium]